MWIIIVLHEIFTSLYFKSENLSMYFPTYNMDFYIFVLLNSQHSMIDHILGHKSSLLLNGREYLHMTSSKGLRSKICKELIKLNIKSRIWFLKRQRTWRDIFPKKTYKWPTDTWKDVQCYSSSEKYSSKPQWNVTLELPEWLLSKRQQTMSVNNDVEKWEL